MIGSARQVGRAIRAARSSGGVSLRELASRVEVSPATISAIENGKTRVDVERLHAIAAALDIAVGELLERLADSGGAQVRAAPVASSPSVVRDGHSWRMFGPVRLDPVLWAAIEDFVEKGYHGSTMRSIALRARMSVPGVYHHYRSKQHLLVACLDVTMSELFARVGAAREEGDDPVARVAFMVEALALFHMHRRKLALIGASEMRSFEPSNRRRISALRNDLQHLIDDEIAEGVSLGVFTVGSPRHAGRAISTMCTSLSQWYRESGPTSPERIARDYARFALGLLGSGVHDS
ncbi:TetR family transcriptional regulator [Nocardia caishijiensis]|uniref:TetR family transcriptional regulator n=1 Tax=Nocardia caishijiensis TaxID=184756 RepID=A0ABQ6YHH4_9NOCA|nr:TetR family transcriptional regulator [Nocardia caishijiensis]KAF0845220.1 TetR family transcriptional regulator [Nocardia caishijiensis]